MSTVSSTHITHYREEGYCLIPNLIPQPLIEAARLRALEIGQQLAPWPSSHFQVLDPERYRSKYDTLLPAGIQRPLNISIRRPRRSQLTPKYPHPPAPTA